MRKALLLALVLTLAACGGGDGKRYYQLPIAADAGAGQAVTSSRHLWVSRVNLSDFLAGNGVVYQTGDVEYTTASNNLWASPLQQQLQQALVAELSNALPGTLVSTNQATGDQDQLEVNVTAFQGRYDGRVIVRGEWLLTHGDRVTRFPFALTLKQDKDGYDALVRTLGLGWRQVAQQIAQSIIQTR